MSSGYSGPVARGCHNKTKKFVVDQVNPKFLQYNRPLTLALLVGGTTLVLTACLYIFLYNTGKETLSQTFVRDSDMKKALLGEANYISTDFVTGKPVESGIIGSLYGVDVVVSTNLPTENTDEKGALLMHKDAIVFAEQLGVRVQTQYKQEFLADLMTADTLFGTETYRPEAGVRLYGTV